MWFAYIDESKDSNKLTVYSALIVESERWNETFAATKHMRQVLKKDHGIYIGKELHAWKFAAGKGRIANRPVDKAERAHIFSRVLKFIATAKQFQVFSSVNANEQYAFERLLNRINRTAAEAKTNAILICDEGQEAVFTKRLRKMRVYNPIPSNQGVWADSGALSRNIPTEHIIEDPFFKDSETSYFVQLVDFIAYALMRIERPLASRTALGYHEMYKILEPVVVKIANSKDPRGLGIIR